MFQRIHQSVCTVAVGSWLDDLTVPAIHPLSGICSSFLTPFPAPWEAQDRGMVDDLYEWLIAFRLDGR